MLSELRKLGYVAYDKHHIVICNFDGLVELLDLDSESVSSESYNIE